MKELGLVVLAGNAVGRDWLQASIVSQLHRLPAQWQVQVFCNLCIRSKNYTQYKCLTANLNEDRRTLTLQSMLRPDCACLKLQRQSIPRMLAHMCHMIHSSYL